MANHQNSYPRCKASVAIHCGVVRGFAPAVRVCINIPSGLRPAEPTIPAILLAKGIKFRLKKNLQTIHRLAPNLKTQRKKLVSKTVIMRKRLIEVSQIKKLHFTTPQDKYISERI